jgi:hypothetical protein
MEHSSVCAALSHCEINTGTLDSVAESCFARTAPGSWQASSKGNGSPWAHSGERPASGHWTVASGLIDHGSRYLLGASDAVALLPSVTSSSSASLRHFTEHNPRPRPAKSLITATQRNVPVVRTRVTGVLRGCVPANSLHRSRCDGQGQLDVTGTLCRRCTTATSLAVLDSINIGTESATPHLAPRFFRSRYVFALLLLLSRYRTFCHVPTRLRHAARPAPAPSHRRCIAAASS